MRTIAESGPLSLPQSDKEAIRFALAHVDPLEIADFLQSWLDGVPLDGWSASQRKASKSDRVRSKAIGAPSFGDKSISDAEMLALLKYPEIAMSFALDQVKPVDVHDFIRDWKKGKSLRPWLRLWRQNLNTK